MKGLVQCSGPEQAIAWPINERTASKLDPDQRRTLLLSSHGLVREELMLSESGLYAMLVHHYHQENRSLRQWITNEVVTVLRDAQVPLTDHAPNLSVLQWPGLSLSLLHWQCEPWIRLRDVPVVLPHPQFQAGVGFQVGGVLVAGVVSDDGGQLMCGSQSLRLS